MKTQPAQELVIEAHSKAIEILRERGLDYGDGYRSFDEAAVVASILSRKEITAYDVIAVLIGLKTSRAGAQHEKIGGTTIEKFENVLQDMMNYVGFLQVMSFRDRDSIIGGGKDGEEDKQKETSTTGSDKAL